MESGTRRWTTSRTIGDKTEIAILSPIKLGRVPNERRTFEERVRFKISVLMKATEQGRPTELSRITTINFARMIIIRPEQYLIYSGYRGFPHSHDRGAGNAAGFRKDFDPGSPETWAFDEYVEEYPAEPTKSETDAYEFRSWLLTQVIFDGDIKVYFRDIAEQIKDRFDDVFFNCEDFPGTGDFEAFWRWIRRYQIPNDLFMSVYSNLSVPRIKYLEEFKQRFDAFVAKVRTPDGQRLRPMDELFDDFLAESQQFADGFPAPGGVYTSAMSDDGDKR